MIEKSREPVRSEADDLQRENQRSEKILQAEQEQQRFKDQFADLDVEREKVAQKLERLRGATLGVLKRRERVPQPLFWSLFHAEVSEIKKRKERERRARSALLGQDPES